MIEVVIQTKKYFQAPRNYFWRWADHGEVIEWMNGSTICYRDDLLGILKELAGDGVPAMGPLLMILLTCKERMHVQHKFFLVRSFQGASPSSIFDNAISFLELINRLPEKYKSGKNRIHLLYEVLGKEDFIFSNIGFTPHCQFLPGYCFRP